MQIAGRGALSDYHQEFYLKPPRSIRSDLEGCILKLFPELLKILRTKFKSLAPGFVLKYQLKLNLELEKYSFDEKMHTRIRQWFVSPADVILTSSEIEDRCAESMNKCIAHYDTFVHKGSGWTLRQVLQGNVYISIFRVFSGGCNMKELPKSLQKAKLISVIPSQKDNTCFLHAIAMALDICNAKGRKKKNPNRQTQSHKKLISLLPGEYLRYPVKLTEIQKFEKLCPISVNVYGYEKGILVPMRVSKVGHQKKFHADLLLYDQHYYTIRNLAGLVRKGTRSNRQKSYVCRYCLSFFRKKDKFRLHLTLCPSSPSKSMSQVLKMPSPEYAKMSFQNFTNLVPAEFVVYADFETCIDGNSVKGPEGGKLISTNKHSIIAWAAYTVCREQPLFSSKTPVMYVGDDAIDKFMLYMQKEFGRIRHILQTVNKPMVITPEEQKAFESAKACAICQRDFTSVPSEKAVRDHSHLSGRYRQALCSSCNLNRAKIRKKVFTLFHGLSNYDSHFIIQTLHSYSQESIRVIPRTSEKYLAFSIGDLVFKDSYQFLSESLSTMVFHLKNKGEEHFHHMRACFSDPKQRDLLYQKGVFPYNHLTSAHVLLERQLPPKSAFYNTLSKSHISEEEYNFAQRVWHAFGCENMKDYLLTYLIADVLLLADCFENFRTNCMGAYELDPVHYYSNAHYSFDAFLRNSGIVLQLFTDVNMHLFVSRAIRGGLSMVSGTRYALANNKFMKGYDSMKQTSTIVDLDANNLYGRIMMDRLPCGEFRWLTPDESLIQHILSCPEDADYGFMLECDLGYPTHLHDWHQDYPLAPTRKSVPFSELSPLAKEICLKHGLKHSTNTPKLMATLEDKKNYILHYRTLQLYLELGMVLDRVHNVIRFRQKAVMRDYIMLNSAKRSASSNSFDINFYKFLNNSLFGKTMERVDNKTLIKLVSNPELFQKLVAKPTFKGSKIINKDLLGVEMNYDQLKINKPTYLGFTILDLAKYHMYKFHYRIMKPHFGANLRLLYTDTDSLIYQFINVPDIYREFAKLAPAEFDFSNYPPQHHLYSEANKKVPGAFKDECGGKQIDAFIGLRSKMYCLRLEGRESLPIKIAKGVKKAVIQNDLKFETYERCMNDNMQFQHSFHSITSKAHSVCSAFQNKVSLSSFDDKRWLVNKYTSLPYGHYLCSEHSPCPEAGTE